ncbi:MAG TPA: protein kinase [Kofleriaceae bacterium]|nr:protein kinase [Kofleriaceae bacterium]
MAGTVTRSTLDIGVQLADTYTIEGLLGTGGMGSVFLASHNRLPGKRVAIKVLNAAVRDADMLNRFRREAQIASKLGHPNIVDVLDFNTLDDGSPYLVLEFLDGESLADRMARGAQPLDFVLSIARQVGSALAAAHRAGVVHRDLKPQNIFLVPTEVDGFSTERAKVFDFGVSKILDSFTVQTQDNQMLGTPQYMSPEQATGRSQDIDGRSDQFALAVIVHELLTGKPAFAGNSIPSILFNVVYEQPAPLELAVPDLPAHIREALQCAMQKDLTLRYPTMEEFIRALTGVTLPIARPSRVTLPPLEGNANNFKAATAATVQASPLTAPATPAVQVPPVTTTSTKPSKTWLFALLAVIGLGGGIAAFVATRQRAAAPTTPSIASTPTVDAAAPTPAVITPDATLDASVPLVDAAPARQLDARVQPVAKPTDARPSVTTQPPVVAQGNAEQQQLLDEGIAALAAGNTTEARRLALMVSDAADASRSQKTRAITVLLEVACRNNKISEAATWFRQLSGSWRSKLKATCSGLGVELE